MRRAASTGAGDLNSRTNMRAYWTTYGKNCGRMVCAVTGTSKVSRFRKLSRPEEHPPIALYSLWLTGEIMIHHRQGFDRYYDLRERVAPPEVDYAASDQECEDYFARKNFAFLGLMREKRWRTGFSDHPEEG